MLVVNDIVLVNTSIAVIGVVFATVWAGTSQWVQEQSRTVLSPSKSSHVVFHNTFSDNSAGNTEDVEYDVVIAQLSQPKDE